MTIEATRTPTLSDSSFDNYVNFITKETTRKRNRRESFKYNDTRRITSKIRTTTGSQDNNILSCHES